MDSGNIVAILKFEHKNALTKQRLPRMMLLMRCWHEQHA